MTYRAFRPRFLPSLSFAAALAGLLVVLTMAGGVFAQGGQDETAREKAARLFREASGAYAAGAYVEAAQKFAAAHATAPRAAAIYNAARSWQDARERARAADAYAMALDLPSLDRARADDARKQLESLRQVLGRLSVDAEVPGEATVAHVSQARLPVSLHVEPGRHRIEVRWLDGGQASRVADVAAGQYLRITFEMQAVPPAKGPMQTAATPMPAPAAARAGERDEGVRFFLGLGLGIGFLGDQVESGTDVPGEDPGIKGSISGGAGSFQSMIGVSLTPRFNLALALMIDSVQNPKVDLVDLNADVGALITWGLLFDVVPSGQGGWHFQVSGGAAHFELKAGEVLEQKPLGGYLMLAGGHDWWVGQQVRMGVMARAIGTAMQENSFVHNAYTISLLGTFTWDRRGRAGQ